jgi:hypothetical protein
MLSKGFCDATPSILAVWIRSHNRLSDSHGERASAERRNLDLEKGHSKDRLRRSLWIKCGCS